MLPCEALEHDPAEQSAAPRRATRPAHLRVHRRGEPAREALEAWLPARPDRPASHVILGCEMGSRLCAVVGLRAGADSRFAAERSFRRPAEYELEHALCVPVERRYVVELDGLRLLQPRHADWLFTELVAFLHGAGFQWAIASMNRRLFRRLEALDFDPVDLAVARDRAAAEDATLCCVSITAAYRRLRRRLADDPRATDDWALTAAAGRRFRIDRAMRLLETVRS